MFAMGSFAALGSWAGGEIVRLTRQLMLRLDSQLQIERPLLTQRTLCRRILELRIRRARAVERVLPPQVEERQGGKQFRFV